MARLGVSEDELAAQPDITSILKENRGGIKLAFKAMRFSESVLIQSFLAYYDGLPEVDRDRIPIEAIALKANINVRQLLGEIILAMRESSLSTVKIIGLANHPQVFKKRIEYAQLPGGFRDRDKIDEIMGIVKAPHGAMFVDKMFVNSKGEQEEPEEEDLDYVFPDCSLMQEKLQPLRQKALPPGKA